MIITNWYGGDCHIELETWYVDLAGQRLVQLMPNSVFILFLNNLNRGAGVIPSLVKAWSIGNGRLSVTEIELGLLWLQTLGGSPTTNFGSNFLEHTYLMRSLVLRITSVWSKHKKCFKLFTFSFILIFRNRTLLYLLSLNILTLIIVNRPRV